MKNLYARLALVWRSRADSCCGLEKSEENANLFSWREDNRNCVFPWVTIWDISRLTSLRVRYPTETPPRDVIPRLGLLPRYCFWWLVPSCINDVLSRPLVSQIAPKRPICCEDRGSLASLTNKTCSGKSTGQSWLVSPCLAEKIRDAAELSIATSGQGGRFSG